CSGCHTVMVSQKFQVALRKPMPESKNFKFLNQQYRGESMGHRYAKTLGLQELIEDKVSSAMDCHGFTARNSPCVRYAIGVLEGKYNDNQIFAGLVEAMVQRLDRQERGVGLQNFQYTPAFEEFAHL
ncbi:hypothetical protein BJ138DRAFT_983430, partial [Hygrophoropsis aurantiaca]